VARLTRHRAVRVAALLLGAALAVPAAGEPAVWQIDPSASRLEFTAEQAGATFRGAFTRFEADVRFDAGDLGGSRARVRIPTSSVATDDDERDGILRGPGWFESEAFPESVFEATSFSATADGFRANGTLTVRQTTVPVVFDFSLTPEGLRGRAVLDRIALGLGLGEWADATWVGHEVTVDVVLVRMP
jgi:polyisoprenoid-binding protein YceI